MDCSLPGSSIHGISQARIMEQEVMNDKLERWRAICEKELYPYL